LALLVSALFSTFPALLIAHVNEVHAYQVLPAVSLLVGLGAGAWLNQGGRGVSPARSIAVSAVLAAVVMMHVGALWEGTQLMVRNGERARRLVTQLVEVAREAPSGSTILVVEPPSTGPGYSLMVVPGLGVLSYAWPWIRAQAGRFGVEIEVVRALPEPLPPRHLAYNVREGDLVPHDRVPP
jgi:hypothetical protein